MAVTAMQLVVALRVWHLLLLKQHLDRPWLVAAWLVAGFASLLAARRLARHTPEQERGTLQRAYARIEGPELTLLALFFVMVFLFHWGFARAASDGREYFVQVRSLVIDGDLDLSNENATFGVRGTAENFAFGAPLLWTPFFVAGHLWLGLLNLVGAAYPRNGFFNPYQRAVGLGSLVYGFVALWLIYKMLSQYFSRRLAAAATLAISCGSFIVWYLVVDNSMSHGASMFSVTLFIYSWHESRGDTSPRRWALLGGTAGLMSLVRWQNVLFVVFPAAGEAGRWLRRLRGGSEWSEAGWLRNTGLRYAAFIGAFLLVFSPQFFFWKAVRGSWFAPPAGGHGAEFLTPALGGVLFSPDRGLYSWTPLLLLATLGLFPFARRHRSFGTLMLAALALQVYINATVAWSGHGFGARRFANCALIFAFGLAALMEWMRRRPALAPALLVGVLVALNVAFMAGMNAGDIPATGTVRFREVVGATTTRIGNPFSLPMAALTALRFDTDLGFYERVGSQVFNNLTIDVGGANDSRFLVRGWGAAEGSDGRSFRWSVGPESSLVVPLREADDYTIEIVATPFRPPSGERQVAEVWINDEMVDRIALGPETRSYRVDVAARHLRAGFNELRFRYDWTAAPAAGGDSRDQRRLAVRFERIALTRAGG